MGIQRWQLNANAARSWLEEDEEGDWVKHSEATAQIERMREALRQTINCIGYLAPCKAACNSDEEWEIANKIIEQAKSALERE